MEKTLKIDYLKRSCDYQSIKLNGQRVRLREFPWTFLATQKNAELGARVGWTLSKKAGGAVVRNKIKRWIREITRTNSPIWNNSRDYNFIFAGHSGPLDLKTITYSEFHYAIEKLVKTAN